MKFILIFLSGVLSKALWDFLFGYYCQACEESRLEGSDNSVTQEGE
jgi:hypothetical protein